MLHSHGLELGAPRAVPGPQLLGPLPLPSGSVLAAAGAGSANGKSRGAERWWRGLPPAGFTSRPGLGGLEAGAAAECRAGAWDQAVGRPPLPLGARPAGSWTVCLGARAQSGLVPDTWLSLLVFNVYTESWRKAGEMQSCRKGAPGGWCRSGWDPAQQEPRAWPGPCWSWGVRLSEAWGGRAGSGPGLGHWDLGGRHPNWHWCCRLRHLPVGPGEARGACAQLEGVAW